MRKNNRKGFTIVELVIVIAVIAILAGVLIPTFAGIVNKANQSARAQEAAAALKAVLVVENGAFDTEKYTYTFVIVDDEDVYTYEYANGKLGEEKELTTSNKKELKEDDGDYLFTANGQNISNTLVTYTEGTATENTIIAVSDLGDVIVLKEKK